MHTGNAGAKRVLNPEIDAPAGPYGPLAPERRIAALDAARGFALLGILLMNIEFFTRPLVGFVLGFDTTLHGADRDAGWLVMAFVQGKFWTLFSLLFGAGFALMLERAQARGRSFFPLYVRRLTVLLLIGLAHTLLIWAGDILVIYAMAGFVLLVLFRSTPVARLWKWGLALYLAPLLLMWLLAGGIEAARMAAPEEFAEIQADAATQETELRERYVRDARTYQTGSFAQVTAQRARDSAMQAGWLPMILPSVLGVFLIGAWMLRTGRLREPERHRGFHRRCLLLGLPLGALLAVLAMRYLVGVPPLMPGVEQALGMSLMGVASLLLCLAYLSALILLVLGPLPALAHWLAPVGRMALSNYLLQSLCFTLLFYGYGLGLWGQVSRAWQIPLALGFFLAQVLLSRWWMTRYRFGPAEWLWRTLTYGRRPAMRRLVTAQAPCPSGEGLG
ncbi:MAG TPA: DUF418 domain-containing protein [Xanthomonadaceae bacterium]|nr:DUF418 domain-containing protein [Xanthomonadaceae bacterium]